MTEPLHKDDGEAERIEAETRRKYSGEGVYRSESISLRADAEANDFFSRLGRIRRDVVASHAAGRRTLDLCCATGEDLLALAGSAPLGVGLDFTMPFLREAVRRHAERGASDARFVCGNARCLPFPDATFGMVYCFASLYSLPRQDEAIGEIARVLEPGGIAAFDLGNRRSLNAPVSRAHTETAAPFYLSVGEMLRTIRSTGLEVMSHRAFQLLPMWGDKPRPLRPLLHPLWKRVMQRPVAGRMIDEWLCAVPGVGRLAFRHLFVCRREG